MHAHHYRLTPISDLNDVLGTSDPLINDSCGETKAKSTALEVAIAASHDATYRAVSTDTNY